MGDVAGPVQRDEFTRVKRFAQVALFVGLAAAAVAVLIGAGVIRIPIFFQSTEEPPIRVRNGSQDAVALRGDLWTPQTSGNKKKWQLMNGTYPHKHLKVVFYYQNGTCRGNFAMADTLTVEYVNGSSTNSFDITQPGHKLKVESRNDMDQNTKQDVISFGPTDQGYISKVFLNGSTEAFCTFASDQDLGAIDIVDW